MARDEKHQALDAELARLGLRIADLPGGGLAGSARAIEGLVARLRSMVPGVTWRDVFPDLPRHWEPGRPETWTTPYRPLGPYDYQELPTGPAVHVAWGRRADPQHLEQLMATAQKAGLPVYGAGLIEITNPDWPTIDAMIILNRGTTEDQTGSFVAWLEDQPGIGVLTIPRTGQETYLA